MAQKWFYYTPIKSKEHIAQPRKNENQMNSDAVHINRGLVNLLKNEYSLSENEWNLVEEAAMYENQWALIGDLFYRYDLEQRMFQFFGELKDYTMQKYDEAEKFNLSEKYTLEYLITLVTGCLETPAEESGCDHSYGAH